MNITGNFTVFAHVNQAKDGSTFKRFSASISTSAGPDKEHTRYVSKSIDVQFDKTNFPEDKLSKLADDQYHILELVEAWIIVKEYQGKDGAAQTKFVLFVKQANYVEGKPLKAKEPAKPKGDNW